MARWSSCALVAVLGFALAGCASNAETGFPDPSEVPTEDPKVECPEESDAAAEEPVEVHEPIAVLDNCYVPKVATVAAGTEIEWIQDGIAPHTVTFSESEIDSHPECSGSVAGSCMADGDTFTTTLDQPGEYIYFCVIHGTANGGGMAATIIVE